MKTEFPSRDKREETRTKEWWKSQKEDGENAKPLRFSSLPLQKVVVNFQPQFWFVIVIVTDSVENSQLLNAKKLKIKLSKGHSQKKSTISDIQKNDTT